MAITYLGKGYYTGLSTDTKPTTGVPTNALFIETDRYGLWIYDGVYWRIERNRLPSVKKTGWWTGLATGSDLMASPTNSAGTTTVFVAADGRGARFDTTTTIGTWAGTRNTTALVLLAWNPIFRARFRINTTNADGNQRFFLGLLTTTTAFANSDDMFNALPAIGIGFRSTDTTYQIVSNDTTGATVFTPITGTPTIGVGIHTFEILGDFANTKWGFSFDGGAFQFLTNDIPTGTAALIPQGGMYNVTGVSRTWDNFWAEIESDK